MDGIHLKLWTNGNSIRIPGILIPIGQWYMVCDENLNFYVALVIPKFNIYIFFVKKRQFMVSFIC